MAYDKRFKRFQEFVEDAPAMSAGAGGVAGIGQPPGTKFGEPPGPAPLGRTKKKRPVGEGIGDWVQGKTMSDRDVRAIVANAKAALDVYPPALVPKLKKLLADVGTGHPNTSAVVRLRQFLRDNGMVYEWDQAPDPIEGGEKLTELTDAEIEKAAKEVHNRWVKNQKAAGETEHKSPDGKEDYMVPYHKLSDKSKDMDREAVRATVDVLDLDEGEVVPFKRSTACPKCGRTLHVTGTGRKWCLKCGEYDKPLREDRETFAGAPVFEVDTDKWMKSRFGKNRYHRYSKYVGEDDQGEEIRQHGRTQRKSDIILKDQATGAMTWFLRRKKAGQ